MSLKQLFDYQEPMVASATLLAVAFIVIGVIGAQTAYRIKSSQETISVTGSAREEVTSDYARWSVTLEARTALTDQQTGLDRLDRAATKIIAGLKEKGVEDVESPSAMVMPNYMYPERSAPVLIGYIVSRQIIMRNPDIERLKALANDVASLSGAGYTVSVNPMELTYRKLDEIRVALLSKAIADARARAEAIAKDSGRSVDQLRSSQSGVVQVLPRGGVEVSDYGSYDTQSMEKDVMVTVRATFSIR
jgi:hypothetical protein